MDIIDIIDQDAFSTIVISELKTFGVKYQKEKKKKNNQKKCIRKNIFCTYLHILDLTDVILANGKVVQIPKFVADACNRVLEQVETEGIFRKAGSFVRQKEIRISLEAGEALGKSHHVIDVANVIKYFFRELPEPLIPPSIQETLLRSLVVGENYVKAILLTCLLLPPLTINTLSFFMQFLNTVSLSENQNRMSVENLAIIFTPGLMPFPNVHSHRFTNHIKVIRVLIENAYSIGTIPRSINTKLKEHSNKPILESRSCLHIHDSIQNAGLENGRNRNQSESAKKKKKRRSGSLIHMFHGLKKIVGSAMGSSEFLDYAVDENKMHRSSENTLRNYGDYTDAVTPCVKGNKKRKNLDTGSAFSIKKKKELQALLPSNSGGFLPNTPISKESKKSRLSLGGGRHIKNISMNPVVTSMERRWSIVGSGWSKTKNKHAQTYKNYNLNVGPAKTHEENVSKASELELQIGKSNNISENTFSTSKDDLDIDNSPLKNAQMEYEVIKKRVLTIENHIINEFSTVRHSVLQNLPTSTSRAELVQKQYERTVVETEALTSLATEQLAQRLSRGLNIRRSMEQRVIRSPSARKIGTIRQRSQDKIRLSRNSSWHIRPTINVANSNNSLPPLELKNLQKNVNPTLFYNQNIKKTVQLNSSHEEIESLPTFKKNSHKYSLNNLENECLHEQWMPGEDFFSNRNTKDAICNGSEDYFNKTHVEHVATPVRRKIYIDPEKTPMLPPKSLPRKISYVRTSNTKKPSTTSKLPFINRIAVSTPVNEEITGRASIARLRAQNAGMVLAKAKLFDGLGNVNFSERGPANEGHNRSSIEFHQKEDVVSETKNHAKPLEKSFCLKETLSAEQENLEIKSLRSTPISKRIQSSNLASPASSSKRMQRLKGTKLPQKQLIKSIVADDKITKRCNLNERKIIWENGINLNTLKASSYSRNNKSPRRIKTNRQQLKLRNSPSVVKSHNL